MGLVAATLFLSFLYGEGLYDLDELYATRFGTFVNLDDKVLFSFVSAPKGQIRLHEEFFLYSFKTEKARHLIHASYARAKFPWILSFEDGFVIFERANKSSPKLHYLDKNGEYKSLRFISNFSGWKEDFHVEAVSTFKKSQIVATIFSYRSKKIHLALVDLKFERINVVYSIPYIPTQEQYWSVYNDKIVYCNNMTGEVFTLDPDNYTKNKILLGKKSLIPNTSKPIMVIKRQSYKRWLLNPYTTEGGLTFKSFMFSDGHSKRVENPKMKLMRITEGNKLGFSRKLLLSRFGNKSLVFNFDDREFLVEN